MKSGLSRDDIKAFEPEAKIGLLATVSPEGLPHLTLITTLQAKTPTQLMWGQFCEGHSKNNVRDDPHVAFLVMSLDRKIWRGTARWTGCEKEGEDYIRFNQMPMFRYNSYFGIHTVHYMDLVSFAGKEDLSLPGVVGGAMASTVAGGITGLVRSAGREAPREILKPWSVKHLSSPTTLKFAAWVKPSGFPQIIPVIPAYPNGADRLTVGPVGPSSELIEVPEGASLALFALNLDMESVLIRGTFSGLAPMRGRLAASLDIDWVYNSMPPLPGQIYPEVPLEPVRSD